MPDFSHGTGESVESLEKQRCENLLPASWGERKSCAAGLNSAMKNILRLFFAFLIPSFGMAQTGSSPAEGRTGIEGVISISPVHGGPIRQGVPSSAPLANIAFEVKQGNRVIKTFQTGNEGRFRVTLKPGQYTISRKDWKGAVGSYGPFEVEVKPGKMTDVAWHCDTGLR